MLPRRKAAKASLKVDTPTKGRHNSERTKRRQAIALIGFRQFKRAHNTGSLSLKALLLRKKELTTVPNPLKTRDRIAAVKPARDRTLSNRWQNAVVLHPIRQLKAIKKKLGIATYEVLRGIPDWRSAAALPKHILNNLALSHETN